jgi:hypothetical protein
MARAVVGFCLLLVACGGATEEDPTDAAADTSDDHVRHVDSAVDSTNVDTTVEQTDSARTDAAVDSATPSDTRPDTTVADTSSSDTHCEDCVSAEIDWGVVGTPTSTDTSSVRPCRVFRHVRTEPGKPDLSCEVDLITCIEGPGITAGDIEGLLGTPAVSVALTSSAASGRPTTFGSIPPGSPHFRITHLTGMIDVGDDCAGAAGCTPVPADVQALVKLLQDVDAAEMKLPVCAGPFPSGW